MSVLRFIILLLTFLASSLLNSQKVLGQKSDFHFYNSNGEKIDVDKPMSINEFVKNYYDSLTRFYSISPGLDDRLYVDLGIISICFKSLTPSPFGIISFKKLSKNKIDSVLKLFTPASYFQTKRFYNDLSSLIKDKNLSVSYVIETLGKDYNIIEGSDSDYGQIIFDKYKLTLFLEDSAVVKFDSKNYAGNLEIQENRVDKYKSINAPCDLYYCLSKIREDGRLWYFLELYSDYEVRTETSPLSIILKNGVRITRNEDVLQSNDDGSSTKTWGRFFLTQTEATLLSKSMISDIKLGDVNEVFPTANAERLMGYFKALLLKN